MSKTVVITSWYFNPLHPGHIECFQLCKSLWDELWVIVNNDIQVQAKTWKSEVFQDEQFKLQVVSALKSVDEVMLAIDVVDQSISVCESIKEITCRIRQKYGIETKIIFGKWGDRVVDANVPEVQVCRDLNVELRDGLWSKTHNSSDYRKKI